MENEFQWNHFKNLNNKKKHNISFEEAVTVFEDELAVLFDDPDHSNEEERFLIIGFSSRSRICIVSHCYKKGNIIRIISARKANKSERDFYNEFNGGK